MRSAVPAIRFWPGFAQFLVDSPKACSADVVSTTEGIQNVLKQLITIDIIARATSRSIVSPVRSWKRDDRSSIFGGIVTLWRRWRTGAFSDDTDATAHAGACFNNGFVYIEGLRVVHPVLQVCHNAIVEALADRVPASGILEAAPQTARDTAAKIGDD